MHIQELVKRAHEMSKSKGWWDECLIKRDRYPNDPDRFALSPDRESVVQHIPPEHIAAKLALVHSELSEALECVRDGRMEVFYEEDGKGGVKPEGFPSELADAVIRAADLAGALGIDLERVVREKMDYNATRKHRHGGRVL